MRDLLGRLNITGLDTDSYIDGISNNMTAMPKIGIAASGGGYRALMNGAGALAAFDSRTTGSSGPGQLGGLMQASTYLSGLSGGGWLVSSIAMNNWTTVESIINGNEGNVWEFSNSILEGPDRGIQILSTVDYYHTLDDQVSGKSDAGYDTSVTDLWGRALSFQLIDAPNGGPAYTYSSLADQSYVTDGTFPLPILIADGRRPGEKAIATNTTIFEFNPWEMGTWDPTIYGFVPIQYVGSNFTDGMLPQDTECVVGYDSASFVLGTSSSLFNQFALQFMGLSSAPSFVNSLIQGLLNNFSSSDNDIAAWVNPFYRYNPNTNKASSDRQLDLVDGGENGENIPLHPLIQPFREVDVIFAIDSSADTTTNWPNGTSLVATYERSQNSTLQNQTRFPAIPDANTFVNLGLNQRPTFFGCDGTNGTNPGTETGTAPLIVYIPNSPYTAYSNLSTFDPSYPTSQRNAVITNGYNVATRGNASTEMWPTCVGCAILRRSLERSGTDFPEVCNTCFTDYCWNGTTDSSTPTLPYTPTPTIGLASNAPAASSSSNNGNAAGALKAPKIAAAGSAIIAALAFGFML